MADYVMIAIGFVDDDVPCPFIGQFLESFNFDADDGQGYGEYTPDFDKAMKFQSMSDALEFWRTPSKLKPRRWDGMPNRPLTCTHMSIRRASDFEK